MAALLHLIGPGGAGKTTIGGLLARRLGWQFLDLDERFLRAHGDIGAVIVEQGYQNYARMNVELYLQLRPTLDKPTVFALSSGFMTYSPSVHPDHATAVCAIEQDPLTSLLLPSYDQEECVRIIVERQLGRPYLPGNRQSEEHRIRQRFPVFIALRCRRFDSGGQSDQTVSAIESFVRNSQVGI